MLRRPRRLRKSDSIRRLVAETQLSPSDFVLPLFVTDKSSAKESITALPGHARLGEKETLAIVERAAKLGIPAIALFPKIEDALKSTAAEESFNSKGLIPRRIRAIKKNFPEMTLITDVALDPYSSEGHDGLVKNGEILNDESIEVLTRMALCQASAGADFVAPSDMMDGRVGSIRRALDKEGYKNTGIISYTAKYASAYYGPFREALDSAPRSGDKKTYQMNPANAREALVEAQLDYKEGADLLMVKPALCYLDIISKLRQQFPLPIAAYNVSGEFAMLKAAAEKGWIDHDRAMLEQLLSIKRAGASVIFTYFALEAAELLSRS